MKKSKTPQRKKPRKKPASYENPVEVLPISLEANELMRALEVLARHGGAAVLFKRTAKAEQLLRWKFENNQRFVVTGGGPYGVRQCIGHDSCVFGMGLFYADSVPVAVR